MTANKNGSLNVQRAYSKEQLDFFLKRESNLHRSEIEWGRIISSVFCEVITMSDVIEVIGAGMKLRAYLINHNKHEIFSGLAVEINELLKTHKQEYRVLLRDDDPFVIWLRTAAYNAGALTLAVKKTLGEPKFVCIRECEKLIEWVASNVDGMVDRREAMTLYVNLGGQQNGEALQALYQVAYSLQDKSSWKIMVEAIQARIDGGESGNIKLIAELWGEKTYNQKRDQLRNMFPKKTSIGVSLQAI